MSDQKISRIIKFVDLRPLQFNKQILICLMIIISSSFMLFKGNSLLLHYDLYTSRWMIYAPFACVLLIWGLYLLKNLEKRQIDFFLYEGCAGIYLTAELFPLSYSFGVQVSHIIPAIVWILILLDIPMLLSMIWARIKLFNGSLKTKKSYYSIGGTITLVLIITPLTNFLLNQTPIDMHYVIADICMFIFSYAMSVLLISFGNYYVAQKYKNIIRLYEDEKARTNRMRKGSHDTRKSKR
jgi:hypothetical protein